MKKVNMSLEQRIKIAQAWIDALLYPLDETIGALGADGWSVAQAREGFALHMQTWDVTRLAQSLQAELSSVGGLAALERPVATPQGARRVHAPQKILHIWPALPGAGITPVLAGWLLGSSQVIRASSRGTYFATHALEVWRSVAGDAGPMLEFEAPGEGWQQADVVVISGSDETVDAVRAFLGGPGHRGRPTVIGFGHRVSAAVVLDSEGAPYARWAAQLARDIVQWHQQGCFSARGVIFCGGRERARVFAATLAAALREAEQRLGPPRDAAQLARRAQARGVAEFTGEVFGEQNAGWVQLTSTPWAGEAIAAHCVTLHVIDALSQLAGAIAVRPHNLQGAALATTLSGPQRDAWIDALARAGFTRVCAPGQLQAPPPTWLHDGAPNVMDWVRVTSVDL
jgi:hypothetical protein